MKVYSQLEVASYENLASDPSLLPVGRMWLNTTSGRPKVNLVAGIKQFMFQDDPLIVGTNGTAATNGKFHRGGVGIIQSVLGNDATAEGTSATSFAQLGFRLENFTFAGKPASGNVGRAIYATDTKQILLDDGVDWSPVVGSGGGGGTENFVTNPSAEINTTGWYVDSVAAATRPTGAFTGVGTGLTFTRSTVAPLNKDASFRLAKDAVNRQGRLAGTNFVLPAKSQAKVLSIRAQYEVASGTFVAGSSSTDSDIIVYIRQYNGSTYTWTEPRSFKFLSNSTTLADEFTAEFQTLFDTISCDLVFYVASTSALAFELKLDDITVSPQLSNQGYAGTDWSAQETTTGSLTNAIYSRKWRQEGDSVRERIRIEFTGAPGGTNPLVITLKNTVDTSKLNGGAISNAESLGVVHFVDSSTGLRYTGSVCMHSTNNQIRVQGDSTISGNWGSTNPFTVAVGDFMEIDVLYPALGFSGNVKMSSPGDGRQAVFTGFIPGAQALTANVTNINLTAEKDTHNGWTGSTYRVEVADDYEVSISGVNSIGGGTMSVYVDGSQRKAIVTFNTSEFRSGTVKIPNLRVGQLISFRQDANVTVTGSATASAISISRLGGSQQISGGETISARYDSSTGQSIPGSAVWTVVNFATRTRDTHGLVSTGAGWRFDGKTAAVFEVSAKIRYANNQTWSASQFCTLGLFKNGVFYSVLGEHLIQVTNTNVSSSMSPAGTDTIDLVDGDYFDIRAIHNEATARLLLPIAGYSFVNIKRQGF